MICQGTGGVDFEGGDYKTGCGGRALRSRLKAWRGFTPPKTTGHLTLNHERYTPYPKPETLKPG